MFQPLLDLVRQAGSTEAGISMFSTNTSRATTWHVYGIPLLTFVDLIITFLCVCFLFHTQIVHVLVREREVKWVEGSLSQAEVAVIKSLHVEGFPITNISKRVKRSRKAVYNAIKTTRTDGSGKGWSKAGY